MIYNEIILSFIDFTKFKIISFIFIIFCSRLSINKLTKVNDKISVILPTYNRGHLIIKSVNSILNQTYQNIEILIVDDGSTDNTEDLIKELDNNKIKYIKLNENKGASYARNIGIINSSGKYIAFQDSDDFYHQNKLEKQYYNLIRKKTDFDFCKICLYFNEENKIIFPTIRQEKNILMKKYEKELCNGNYISTQSILVKKSCITRYLFDIHFPRLQDYDLVLRMVPNIKVSYTNEILVDMYRKNDSIGNSDKKLNDSLSLLLKKKYDIKCNFENIYNIFKNSQK